MPEQTISHVPGLTDAAVLQAFLDRGGAGVLDPGLWTLTAPVWGSKTVSLRAPGALLQQAAGRNLDCLMKVHGSGSRFTDLAFDGDADEQTGGLGRAFWAVDAQALTLDGVTATATRGEGLTLEMTNGRDAKHTLRGCRTWQTGSRGLYLFKAPRCKVSHGDFADPLAELVEVVELYQSPFTEISATDLTGGKSRGLGCDGSPHSKFARLTVWNVPDDGISISGSEDVTTEACEIVSTTRLVGSGQQGPGPGVAYWAGSSGSCSGCTVKGKGHGIVADGRGAIVHDLIVTENRCLSNYMSGLAATSAGGPGVRDVTFEANISRLNAHYGALLQWNVDGIVAVHNKLGGNALGPTNLDAIPAANVRNITSPNWN